MIEEQNEIEKNTSKNGPSMLTVVTILNLLVNIVIIIFFGLRSYAITTFEPIQNTIATPAAPGQTITETIGIITDQLNQVTANNNMFVDQVSTFDFALTELLDFISSIAENATLPLLALLAFIVYHSQLGTFLKNIAERTKTDTFEVGNIKFTKDQLLGVLAEREQLRLSLEVANSDKHLDPAELGQIISQAKLMKSNRSELTIDEKWIILTNVIDVALSDKTMDESEYRAIESVAETNFEMNRKQIDKLNRLIITRRDQMSNILGEQIKLPRKLELTNSSPEGNLPISS